MMSVLNFTDRCELFPLHYKLTILPAAFMQAGCHVITSGYQP